MMQERNRSLLDYYTSFNVQYAMSDYTKTREFAMIMPKHTTLQKYNTRNLCFRSIQDFHFLLNKLKAYEGDKQYNLYYSLAQREQVIPRRNLADMQDKRDVKEWLLSPIISYDLLIDIDMNNRDEFSYAKESMLDIKRLYDTYRFPYELRWSGRGFHLLTDGKYFNDLFSYDIKDKDSIYKKFHLFAKMLYSEYSEFIDIKIYDSKRLCKLPYSVAIYEDDMQVCQPISPKEHAEAWDIDTQNLYSVGSFQLFKNKQVFNPHGEVKTLFKNQGLL